jgi:hypothetical protein
MVSKTHSRRNSKKVPDAAPDPTPFDGYELRY